MVITKDEAWLSTFREVSNIILFSLFAWTYLENPFLVVQDEAMVSDSEELLEQVLASHDVRIENGQYPNKSTPHKSHKYLKVSSAWTGKKYLHLSYSAIVK